MQSVLLFRCYFFIALHIIFWQNCFYVLQRARVSSCRFFAPDQKINIFNILLNTYSKFLFVFSFISFPFWLVSISFHFVVHWNLVRWKYFIIREFLHEQILQKYPEHDLPRMKAIRKTHISCKHTSIYVYLYVCVHLCTI